MEYLGRKPLVGRDVFIAPTAMVLGDVEIGDGSSIWYGAVIRGDQAKISIGKNTNIQDNAVLHTDLASPLRIGDNVTVGHGAVVHGCTIEDDCLIGIGSIILNDALVKNCSVVASGSLVGQRQVVGPLHLVAGSPAVVKRELAEEDVEKNREIVQTYRGLAHKHRSNLDGFVKSNIFPPVAGGD
ncbi:MAG TPA: gamma carbonic anhydrase family protein [Deltaproteobacteria bacterium]|nr:gamma carbonic anhydrase family protein [Deltaproteobacteria bacterium]